MLERNEMMDMDVLDGDFQHELARERALDGVQRAVRDLAANILNVVRGAGRSEKIAAQAQALVHAMEAHRSIAGCAPSSSEIAGALNIIANADRVAMLNVQHRAELHATQSMIFGALMIAGSRLTDIRAHTPGGIEGLTEVDYSEEPPERRDGGWLN
jgi:hypothetical protein